MAIGWNFPSNNNGKIVGISEAGIETFRGSLFSSLAREICQNSLDARVDLRKPVIIDFKLNNINTKDILGFSDLTHAIELCKDFWNDNEKTLRFFKNAIKVCQSKKIRILRISDYNTTGLTGSDKIKSSPWQNLVKSSGVSDKNGNSGGSYGIGKSAPFACSDLRTVFYRTLDINGLKASQGVANLVSFQYLNELLEKKDITQGTGYYGEKTDNSVIKDFISLDGYEREITGTDVYILGFIDNDEWKDEVIKSVIDGYLISILQDDMKITIDDIVINKDTIGDLIEKYKDEIPLAYNYYEVLLPENNAIHIKEDFKDLGNLSLYVLIRKGFRRKVLMSRSNGMKIFDKQNISGTIQFAGVCILEDDKINAYFREMETPQHNDWEPDRHSNKKEAKKMRTDLFRFIKEKVLEIGKETVSDEMDAVGAGEFMPDIYNYESSNSNKIENIVNEVKEYSIEKITTIKTTKGIQSVEELGIDGDIDIKGVIDEESNFPAFKYGGTDTPFQGLPNYNKNTFGYETELGNTMVRKTISIKPLRLRLFIYDHTKKIYKLSFTPDKNANNCYVEISIVGEQSNLQAEITYASTTNYERLIYKRNRIYIGNIESGKIYTFLYSINYTETCSMEVLVHGYKI